MNINPSYLLSNTNNYNNVIDSDQYNINNKYSLLVIDYLKNIVDNNIQKNKIIDKFIILRGLNTITHVYTLLIYYTKNVDLAYYHAQKSFYFYIEFIEQITSDKHTFLNLTSKDACMFVYKKSIFEINNELKKSVLHKLSAICSNKINMLNNHISIFKNIIHHNLNNTNNNTNNNINGTLKNQEQYFSSMITSLEKINKLLITKVVFDNIDLLEYFIEVFKCNNSIKYYEIIELFIKKINKIENVSEIKTKLKIKIIDEQFYTKTNDDLVSPQKLVNWIVV